MNDLVQRLATGSHPVEVSLRPERTLKLFKEMIDRNHVLIKLTQTRGGTELGVPLDKTRSDLTQVTFDEGTGKVHIAGEITLDYVPVRVVADIDLGITRWRGPSRDTQRKARHPRIRSKRDMRDPHGVSLTRH